MKKLPHTIQEISETPSLLQKVEAVFDNIAFELEHYDELYPAEAKFYFSRFYKNAAARSKIRERYYLKRIEAAASLAVGKRILIIGSRLGTEAFILSSAGAKNVLGIDISPTYAKLANERKKTWEVAKVEFQNESVFNLDDHEAFDLIFMMESLHRIVPRDEFFEHVPSLLSPEGRLIISEPNGGNPLLMRSTGKKGEMTGRIFNSSGFFHTDDMYLPASEITKFLNEPEFSCEFLSFYRLFPGISNNFIEGMVISAEQILEKILPLPKLGIGYTIILRKNP